jgi:hypothetical protein
VTSLFANQREAALASAVALVEQALGERGQLPAATRAADPNASQTWHIVIGSVTTRVTVSHRNAFPQLRVSSVVMTLDATADRAALFAHLLDLNASLCGAAFATEDEQVLLVSERSTLDLDLSEVLDVLERVTSYAVEYHRALATRFGGRAGAS